MNVPRYVIVANPDGKRWQAYERDLLAYWRRRGCEPHVTMIPWRDVVPRRGQIDDLLKDDQQSIFRLESPGRDQEVMRLLLEAGDAEDSGVSWRHQPIPKGALIRPGQLYRGFCRTLSGLRATLDRRTNLLPL